MPIKFRCPHCRQFLGISRAQAGRLVDCPGCGRTLPVPQLDGRIDPIPEPQLDPQDRRLASALDELAHIDTDAASQPAASEAPPGGTASSLTTSGPGAGRRSPTPPPAVQATPQRAAAAPGAVRSGVSSQQLVAAAPSAAPRTAGLRTSNTSPTPTAASPALDPFAAMASIAAAAPARPVLRPAGPGLTRRDAVIAGVSAVLTGFPAWWLGRSQRGAAAVSSAPPGSLKVKAGGPSDVRPLPEGSSPSTTEARLSALPAGSLAPLFVALRGRISYVAANGQTRPDVGARVLALPEISRQEAKAPVVGFRAGAADADVQLAQESLRGLGGGFAVADGQGQYELLLPTAGAYHLLIISRYAAADARRQTPAELPTLLEKYFEQPQLLLGKTDFNLSLFRCRGGDAELRDHVFQRM